MNNYNPNIPLPTAQTKFYNDMYQCGNHIVHQNAMMSGQLAEAIHKLDIVSAKKERKRIEDIVLSISSNNMICLTTLYSDRSYDTNWLISNAYGPFKVTILSFAQDKYNFFLIQFGDETKYIIGKLSELSENFLYQAMIRKGIQFNPNISLSKIKRALYNHLVPEIEACENIIEKSGLAGWENQIFTSAEDVDYLKYYKNSLHLPIFKKSFDKDASNLARIDDYIKFIQSIKDEQKRVLLALLPFAGITYSLLDDRYLTVPFVINFIIISQDISVLDIAKYLQIFNRNTINAYDVDDTDKNISSVIRDSKDEVLIFAGLKEEEQTYYKNTKISKNLHMIAQKALGRNGNRYGDNKIRSIVTLFSSEMLLLKGVTNIFIEQQDICNEFDNDTSLDAILALFILYAESHMTNFIQIMEADYKTQSKEEKYWKIVLAIVDEFWRGVSLSSHEVLNLSDNFKFDFLWEEDSYDLQNTTKTLVTVVRKSMPQIPAISRESIQGKPPVFVYDKEYIWISPELFLNILKQHGLLNQKNHLLLQCKEEGILKTTNYSGYTTRLQIESIRKEYYCFKRSIFTSIGQAELIDLSRRNIC